MLAETVIGLFKTESYRRGPRKGLEDVEFTALEGVVRYNRRRLLEPLGHVPPAEFEQAYHDRQTTLADMAVLTERALRRTRVGSSIPCCLNNYSTSSPNSWRHRHRGHWVLDSTNRAALR
jgi:hypothetical protein